MLESPQTFCVIIFIMRSASGQRKSGVRSQGCVGDLHNCREHSATCQDWFLQALWLRYFETPEKRHSCRVPFARAPSLNVVDEILEVVDIIP